MNLQRSDDRSLSTVQRSGLLKMMTVGMGRANGADMFHSLGASRLAEMIPLLGGRILEHAPIIGGIAVILNAKKLTQIY
jgi:hypothetical protein